MKQYRLNSGIVVFNDEGKVLMLARADKPDFAWQFPQGGIDEGETPLEAAYRELREETGITSVELVALMEKPLRYDFPNYVLKIFGQNSCPYAGQEQYWALFKFMGEEAEINYQTHPEEIEFKAHQWIDIKKAPSLVVDFKQDTYQKMVDFFEPYIKNDKNQK